MCVSARVILSKLPQRPKGRWGKKFFNQFQFADEDENARKCDWRGVRSGALISVSTKTQEVMLRTFWRTRKCLSQDGRTSVPPIGDEKIDA